MPTLKHHVRGLISSRRMHTYMEANRENIRGQPLWSEEELCTLRRLYPDYSALQAALPRRTYYAIRNQALLRGIAKRRPVWTNVEIARLRQLYARGATRQELVAAFPGMTLDQITGIAAHRGFARKRRPPKALGLPILDDIRQRAFALRLSFVDLDELAGTDRFFQCCRLPQGPSWRHIARAADLLGGRLTVEWDQEGTRAVG